MLRSEATPETDSGAGATNPVGDKAPTDPAPVDPAPVDPALSDTATADLIPSTADETSVEGSKAEAASQSSVGPDARSLSGPGGSEPGPRTWLSAWRTPGPARKKRIGWVALGAAFIIYVAVRGIPYSSDVIILWITAALFVSCIGESGRWKRGVVVDWLPLYLVLAVYDLLRGYASDTLWGPFIRPQTWFDSRLFGGVAPTVQLQRWLFNPHNLHVWDYAVWLTYMSHFFTSFIIAGVLWKRDYPRFRRFVPLFVGLTALGYLTYVLYPAMPPWLASQTGHLAHTTRIIPVMWNHVGLHQAAALFTGGNRFDNNIAAMPSLHAAYPMLFGLFFWSRSRPRLRAVLVTYPLGHGLHPGLLGRALRHRRLRRTGAMPSPRTSSGPGCSTAGRQDNGDGIPNPRSPLPRRSGSRHSPTPDPRAPNGRRPPTCRYTPRWSAWMAAVPPG